MTQPVSYLQTDPRWSYKDYSAKGETTTIGASGCGPTAMAMVLATWADPKVTPATECAWALANGYKAPHQGTYYAYFVPAGARYGLRVQQLNWSSLYGNAKSAYHAQARDAVDRGDLVIACMGKGNWTSSGHFVLVWKIEGDVIYINDPASTKLSRTQGSWALFRQQVKYYWTIERPATLPAEREEEEIVDIDKLIAELTPEQAYRLLEKAESFAADRPQPEWSEREGYWSRATQAGITDGSAPQRAMRRCEVVAVLGRLGLVG